TPADGEAKPAETPPAESQQSAGEKPAEDAKPVEEGKQSAAGTSGSMRLAVASGANRATMRLASADADENQAPEVKEPAATETPPAAPAADEAKPEESKPADSADADKSAEEKPAAAPEPKYEPLEKVQDKIRDSVAAEKARNRVREIFE